MLIKRFALCYDVNMSQKQFFLLLGAVYLGALGWSAWQPHDYPTWLMEVGPSLVGVAVLALTYRRFKFSRAAYLIVLVHSLILIWGAKYTYAENPLFNYLKDVFDWQRNNYDKLGHFVQGFFPAFLVREVVIRQQVFAKKSWISWFVMGVVALVTSIYEIIEWSTSVLLGGSADAFLGTQGYVWDTQSDMLLALVGGLIACVCFGAMYDRYLAHTTSKTKK